MISDSPNHNPNTNSTSQFPSPQRISGWRFWVPLVLQSALIVAIPTQSALTYFNGRQITLQTAPVDPYDLLRGYSQTLSYNISSSDDLKKLPGGKEFFNTHSTGNSDSIYVVLEAPANEKSNPPAAWKPVRVSEEYPANLKNNQVAIKGDFQGWRIVYGLETYYMPENQRQQINAEIQQAQRQKPQSFVVDVRVDAQGKSVPVSLWVRDRNYRF